MSRERATLSFPNPSRSFDPSRNCVLFWGYVTTIEVRFNVEAEALRKLCPDMDEGGDGCLGAFDAERTRIHDVAEALYLRGGGRSRDFTLTAAHFE